MSNRIKVGFSEIKPFVGDKEEGVKSNLFLSFMVFFNIFRRGFADKVFFCLFESSTGNMNIVTVSAVANFKDKRIFCILPFENMSREAVGGEIGFESFSHIGNLLFGKNDFRRNRRSGDVFVCGKIGLMFLKRIEKAGKQDFNFFVRVVLRSKSGDIRSS